MVSIMKFFVEIIREIPWVSFVRQYFIEYLETDELVNY